MSKTDKSFKAKSKTNTKLKLKSKLKSKSKSKSKCKSRTRKNFNKYKKNVLMDGGSEIPKFELQKPVKPVNLKLPSLPKGLELGRPNQKNLYQRLTFQPEESRKLTKSEPEVFNRKQPSNMMYNQNQSKFVNINEFINNIHSGKYETNLEKQLQNPNSYTEVKPEITTTKANPYYMGNTSEKYPNQESNSRIKSRQISNANMEEARLAAIAERQALKRNFPRMSKGNLSEGQLQDLKNYILKARIQNTEYRESLITNSKKQNAARPGASPEIPSSSTGIYGEGVETKINKSN